eukprot:54296-Prorocentrum_minimum.AAC.2
MVRSIHAGLTTDTPIARQSRTCNQTVLGTPKYAGDASSLSDRPRLQRGCNIEVAARTEEGRRER